MLAGAALAAIVNAYLYRFGGCSCVEGAVKYPWVPMWMFNSKTRDAGCSLVTTGWMAIFYPHVAWYIYVVTFGALWGMTSMYWDEVFGYDNFWFHGFMIGVVKLWFAIMTGMWLGYAIHCVVLALVMGGISALSGNVDVEEMGRGAATGATLPLMMVNSLTLMI
jgi:hypothetical protein